MRIGILSDIHDAVGPLESALTTLGRMGVDQVVTLGDAFETFHAGGPGARVARLLRDAGAAGVWGNHDYGLSREVSARLHQEADPGLLAFAAGLAPQMTVDGCRFCHIEPWRDPCRIEDLWAYDGLPDTDEAARRSLDVVPERILFMGHFHFWLVMRGSGGRLAWEGVDAVDLAGPERFLVVVAAVVDGWCAMFETRTARLTPVRCSP